MGTSQTPGYNRSDCLAIWNTNEALLQSYRTIFISSQSFLLAVGAIVMGKSLMVLLLTFAVGLFIIAYIWYPVVRSRHKIVDYYKYCTRLDDASRAEFMRGCSEKDYVENRVKRAAANTQLGIRANLRTTRFKVDILIPICFLLIWIVLVVYGILTPALA